MIRRPPRSTRTDTLFPYTTLFRSRRNLTGAVTKMLEEAGLRIVASRRIQMTKEPAEGFYAVHKERPFFNDLVSFMISGLVVVQVLEGEDAVKRNRDRSEERRVGKKGVSTCDSGWSPCHKKKKITH